MRALYTIITSYNYMIICTCKITNGTQAQEKIFYHPMRLITAAQYCFLSLSTYAVINKTALFQTVITPNKFTYSIKTAVTTTI